MIKNTVYLVKFETGYDADDASDTWSFTDDPYLAKHHKSHWIAERFGYAGTSPSKLGKYGTTFKIEKFELQTTMKFIE